MNQDENNPLNDTHQKTEDEESDVTQPRQSESARSSSHDSKPLAESASEPLFVGKLIEREGTEDTVREGSPFRVDPPDRSTASQTSVLPSGEPAYGDYGPFQYTAMGASASAVVVLLFAALGAGLFPIGGVLVAILGGMLSLVGLFSTNRFRIASILTLIAHASLFLLSYARSLT